jgi:hypothetical protein
MFFHFKSLLYAILFFASFQFVILNPGSIWYIGIFLVILSIWVSKKISRKHRFAIIPVYFSLSSIILFYLIDLETDQQVFILLASLVYYFILLGIFRIKNYSKDRTARGILAGGMVATIFMCYAGFYGLYLNFSIPLWLLMLIFLLTTFSLSHHYLSLLSSDKNKVLSYSLILGLSMAEISWVINFWPFGYLTTGVIALIFYYMFWDIADSYFINKLSRKKIVINLIFFSLLIGLILFSSRWQLAV